MADTAEVLSISKKLDDVLTAGSGPAPVLKIKGLADAVTRVRSGILAARAAASGVDNAARAFVASANALCKQIDDARSDIEFEATQLGNSPPASDG